MNLTDEQALLELSLTPKNSGPRPDTDYIFEESDDPRTFLELLELCPDSINVPTLEIYYRDFLLLLELIGKVAYNYKMKRNLELGNQKVVKIAEQTQHTLASYTKYYRHWREEAYRSLTTFARTASYFGVAPPSNPRDFLNSLIDADRRDAYRQSIRLGIKHREIFSPTDLEERYQERLKKRAQRPAFTKNSKTP